MSDTMLTTTVPSTEVQVLNNTIDSLRKTLEDYRADAKLISDRLISEANDRGWCDLYNEFVEEVNDRTKYIKLETLEQEYTVKMDLTLEITTSVSVNIKATSEQDAIDMVEEKYSNSDLIEEAGDISYWDYDRLDLTVDNHQVL